MDSKPFIRDFEVRFDLVHALRQAVEKASSHRFVQAEAKEFDFPICLVLELLLKREKARILVSHLGNVIHLGSECNHFWKKNEVDTEHTFASNAWSLSSEKNF